VAPPSWRLNGILPIVAGFLARVPPPLASSPTAVRPPRIQLGNIAAPSATARVP